MVPDTKVMELPSSEVAVGKIPGQHQNNQDKTRNRRTGGNGEIISPFVLAHLPQDFDFVASKTQEEKVEYIKSVLARSEDEAIALIVPALQMYGTAAYVVETYLPLILEVKKHVCRPGRPKLDPMKGTRNRAWKDICEECFHIGIRRMEQILASLKEPKAADPGQAKANARKQPINRKEYERAKQVAAPATTLAVDVLKNGMGAKFPAALEILKLARIPAPLPGPASNINETKYKELLAELVATLEEYADRLPAPVVDKLTSTRELLNGQVDSQMCGNDAAVTQGARPALEIKPLGMGSDAAATGRSNDIANHLNLEESDSAPQPGVAPDPAFSEKTPVKETPTIEEMRGVPSPGRSVSETSDTTAKGGGASVVGDRHGLRLSNTKKLYIVEEQARCGGSRQFAVVRVDDREWQKIYESKKVAEMFCEMLNATTEDTAMCPKPPKVPQGNPVTSKSASSETQKHRAAAAAVSGGSRLEKKSAPEQFGAGQTPDKQYCVKKRISGDLVDFAVFPRGDRLPERVFNSESEAKVACEQLNTRSKAGTVLPAANSQSASQANA
jgi:hypothetical protein